MKHPNIRAWRNLVTWLAGALVAAVLLPGGPACAQEASRSGSLPRDRYRAGEQVLEAFTPVVKPVRDSVVKLNVDGATVGLATVMSSDGLALAKRSEITPGKLTCWLASDREVPAELLASDDQLDLALVRIEARGLKPIHWNTNPVVLGQWAVSPGIVRTPHAVGIVSARPHSIRAQRPLIGVLFEPAGSNARIEEIMGGLGAEKAGLKPGDVILSINNRPVTNRVQVVDALRNFREGQKVTLRVQRVEDEFDAQVELMAAHSSRDEPANRLAGELSRRANGFEEAIEHDSVLPPWLCGGPLINLEGEGIGVNIARASRVSTYALPASLVLDAFKKLKTSAVAVSVSAPVGGTATATAVQD